MLLSLLWSDLVDDLLPNYAEGYDSLGYADDLKGDAEKGYETAE